MKYLNKTQYRKKKTVNHMRKTPKLALSSRYSIKAEELIAFCREAGLDGIEYTIQSETKEGLDAEFANMKKLAESGIEIRYHFQFKTVEPAHRDAEFAARSVRYYKDCLDAISKLGGRHIIIHLCLNYKFNMDEMCFESAKRNTKEVVDYARAKGITVCLENLTFGFTCEPDPYLALLKATGASANIDIGHASASPIVMNNIITAEEFMEKIIPHTVSAHVYKVEINDDVLRKGWHIAPDKKEDMESRLNLLLNGRSDWWLIELGDREEILRTKKFIEEICADYGCQN